MHRVDAKSILSQNNGMNTYRGCSHGCIYCDSRSLCYGMEHQFEDIEIKQNAPQLLERALSAKRRRCMIGTGSMCDPYLHIEATELLTRRCLEVIDRHAFGVSVLTKSDLILRDSELLCSINSKAKAVVQMTLTTFDDRLCRILEPNVCVTSRRCEVLQQFRQLGIPTFVWLSPLLPYINDTEENLRGILDSCFQCGVKGIVCFGMGLTLREGSREYFYSQLDRSFPGLRKKYESRYGLSYELPCPDSDRLMRIFTEECSRRGVLHTPEECFGFMRQLPENDDQLSLF